MKDENKNDTIVFASLSRSEHVLFDLEKSISKFDLRSGRGQVMTEEGQYAICISSEAA